MGNFITTLKRFLSNKNTVTILGVVAGVLVLYIGYNWRVKQAIQPVTVPYAKVEISSRTQITEDMIGYMEVSSSVVSNSPNLIQNASQIINNYAAYGVTIPANSLFYTEAIMTKAEMPDSAFADIPDGYTIYPLDVNLQTTYGNSIYPGNYIDLYLKATDDSGKIIFGKLIESIEVLAVKDSQGNHVFETTVESRTPAVMLFAVPDDMYLLLKKAEYISGGVDILPVPRNASYSANPGETSVASDYIKNYILSKTATIPDNVITSTTTTTTTTDTDED
jgi:hypothetical protein